MSHHVFPDGRRRGVKALAVPVPDDQPGSLPRQPPRDGEPDARGRAGDNRCLAFETYRSLSSVSWGTRR
jgi:hypothetical protein